MLLKLKNVTKSFSVRRGSSLLAVNNVTFSIEKGEVFALVGKSGSGKSTIAQLILNVFPPTKGSIFFEESPVQQKRQHAIQMVFQDPTGSLNPKLSIQKILEEPGIILGEKPTFSKLLSLLSAVQLPKSFLQKFPRECSGGEQQRINIARAISTKPKLIICDEILASLDEPKKEKIVDLLLSLKKEYDLSYLFITHHLYWAKKISTKMGVLFEGTLVETNTTTKLFQNAKHPYTKELLTKGLSF